MGRGKSKVSCFNIMSCAGDGGDKEEMEPLAEVKEIKSRRRWSFQRRSSRDHSLDDVSGQFLDESGGISLPVSVPSEKNEPSDTEKNESSSSKVLEDPDPVPFVRGDAGSGVLLSSSVHLESAATAIQTAIRGCLARKEILKCKMVIKLQAAWRGHMVRKQAVGTLRCIQAIVKMQALVRARHKRNKEMLDEPEGSAESTQGKESSVCGLPRCPPTEKFLKNAFSRLILESTPRRKPIYISCDSSRSGSAWRWLDVWMAVTLSDNKLEEPDMDVDRENIVKKVDSYIASHNTRDVHNLTSIQSGSPSLMKDDQEHACFINSYSNSIAQNNQYESTKEAFDPLESPVSPQHHVQTAILEDDTDISCSFALGSPCISGDEVASELEALETKVCEPNSVANIIFNFQNVNFEGNCSPLLETVGKDMLKEVKGFPQNSVPETSSSQTIPFYREEDSSRHAIEQKVPYELQIVCSPSGTSFKSTTSSSESQGIPSRHSLTKLKNSAKAEKNSGRKKKSDIKKKKVAPKTKDDSVAANDTLASQDNKNASDPLQKEKFELKGHEPRLSIGDSLPSYMQLTKCARAKFHANNSKMSSVDMDDNKSHRDNLSLSSGVGKHDTSPRVQSDTQGKYSSKGKGQGPQERNWQTG